MRRTHEEEYEQAQLRHRRRKNFEHSKVQCLGKRDKSFAGRIDVKAVEICSVINERDEFYTTSSCAGRCFLYRGHGIKSSHFLDEINAFERFRISHDLVVDDERYFNLSTLSTDPTGGGDPIRSIGQFEHGEKVQNMNHPDRPVDIAERVGSPVVNSSKKSVDGQETDEEQRTIWLRFEPFILHVCCRSLAAASGLMSAARPSFKNVGLTAWKENKYLVAIWGDEGLDMPITDPNGTFLFKDHEKWLKQMINERHERNWTKIDRFVDSIRALSHLTLDDDDTGIREAAEESGLVRVPKSYDIVGDVALVYSLPPEINTLPEKEALGKAIMTKNRAIKVCALRTNVLRGLERAPGELEIIAGANRSPLITTHSEYGVKCVVDLGKTFFSPRMGHERLRLCQQVARGERVLVLFAGVGMEALQIAARTEASKVVAIELNPVAVRCARNSHKMLARNKSVKCLGAAERLEFIEGDVSDVLVSLEERSFDRALVPRPKEGKPDGDLGDGSGGLGFLAKTLPLMKERGEIHWYDFVADHEFPACDRTEGRLRTVCRDQNFDLEIIHVANVGSVAKRQLRVCIDFRVHANE